MRFQALFGIRLSEMNKPQWAVLTSAIAISLVSILLPPWLYRCEGSFSYSAGYHFFAKPPEIKNVCISSNPLPAPPPTVVRNGNRQSVQGLVLMVLTAGIMLILKTPRTNFSVVLAVLIISIGIVGLMYLGLMIRFEV